MTPALCPESPWKALGKLYVFFLYFSAVYQLLILLSGTAGGSGLRQAIYVSLLWLVPPLLWPACTRRFAAIAGGVLWLMSLFGLGYFSIYQQDFSQSALFIIFESNGAEGSEFFQQYFRWWMLPAALLYGVIPLWWGWHLEPPLFSFTQTRVLVAGILAWVLVYPVIKPLTVGHPLSGGLSNLENKLEPALPWQLILGYAKYHRQLAEMNSLLEKNHQAPALTHFQVLDPDAESTLVLVIGESTSSQRMGLYGYGRDTTPELDSIRDQLVVFKHVFTPRPYTIEALEQVLTFADQQHPDLYLTHANLLNIMKQAGYKTWWITNQQTLTARNTQLTTFSRQADQQIYLNNNRMQNASQHDGVVVDPFRKILSDPAKRKFIVVHLLGTHMKYKYRYPEEYAVFNERDGVPRWVKESDLDVYNEYDNAVRYNDHVVYSLISAFSAVDPNGILLYLSDHGEEVYDDEKRYFNGRSEGNPSSHMYTIPFLLWASPRWQGLHPVRLMNYQDRVYSSSDLLHTWVDLSGIHFDQWEPTKSIVNENFVSRPILIGNPAKPSAIQDVTALGWLETKRQLATMIAQAGIKKDRKAVKTRTQKPL